MSNRVSNLVELLQSRLRHKPLQRVYTFLDEGEAEAATLTYQQLDQRARAIATALQQLNARGERVLLLFPPGLEYVSAFWGCLYAGAIAVPAYPPRQNRSLLRLQSVTADAGATIALTTRTLLAKTETWESRCPDLKCLRWLATDAVADSVNEYWRTPYITESDLAFLQYTSGSVATPKGVMVTHGNLLSNERMIQEAFEQTEDSLIVGWLPLYHDMGLIGNVLQPVYSGSQCVLMSPVSFLQEPFRWLSAISRYRATTSGGPNFAYDLCVRKISPEQRALLDLSSWKIAFNGAEPVRASSMSAFAEAFGPSGFRSEAFRPCYGLAEATLLVSSHDSPSVKNVDSEALQNNIITEVADGRSLVSCGRSVRDQQIHILRPDSMVACAAGEIGEICVSGPNVTGGYWNRPEETERSFQRLSPTDKPRSLLRTGDLGALLDGELFVTGRLKDLIIIRGRNHYPQDIERTVELSHPALRPGSGAAFVVEIEEQECLVVAQELNGRGRVDSEEIVRAITQAVLEEHELQLHAVVLLRQGGIPKTSSGKIQRFACREKFLSGDFVADWYYSAPVPGGSQLQSVEEWLKAEVAVQSGVSVYQIDVNRPLSAYALDSLKAIELTYLIEKRLGVVLSMAELLESPSIAEIAARTQVAPTRPETKHITAASSMDEPLSAGQQALWFLHQLDPDSSAYNIASAVRVVSELNVSALRCAFKKLADRHSALRVTFSAQHGAPVQRVAKSVEPYFQEVDASGWTEEFFDRRLVEEANRPFDLETGPLLRVNLFRRAENNQVLLIVVHHIIADFWSLSVLTHELGAIYTAELSGTPIEPRPLQFQYADYVQKQQAMLTGPEGERLWQYWQKQLAGDLPLLNLPTEHARPPIQTYRGSSEAFKLDEEITRSLKELSREHGATLYTTLLAAFQVLLFRHTGQEDILVGSPTSGRTESGLGDLVGYFVNPVVLRSHPRAGETFSSFLDQTRTTVLQALQHQSYPFPLLVEKLQPQRDPSRSPLFQVMFILQKAHLLNEQGLTELALGEDGRRVKVGALELESVALSQQISQFDLTLTMVESGESLSGSLQFNTDLFTHTQITRMIGHLKTLLRSITTTPEQVLAELPILTQTEAHQLLVDWNQTSAGYRQHLCLQQLFEEQAKLQPDRVALICGERRMSYGELDARANQLAHYLTSLGVGPETFAGLLLERSADLVIAMLAVLKAGGAYLPLEPAYPEERLRFIVEDTGAGILLTQNSLLSLAKKLASNSEVVCLERDRNAIASQPVSIPVPTAVPENMAYVIYTSGSTGIPKGVIVNHSSAVVMVQWARECFTREQLAGVLASTSISFDLSVFELFAPLSVGGAVILSENVLQLPALPAASEVTLINTVPSAMSELVRTASVPSSAQTICLAGEALSRELVDRIYALGTVREVFNLYGPSEDTTYSTYALISSDETGAPVIGRPLSETQLYVMDAAGQPVPVGVPGELFIGGSGLGRGYWRRPDLTAEKFVPDPFGAKSGARLYRTGDLARYRPDGMLEYLGRVDHQVKVRGYRIELEEIESALRRHSKVKEAVVVVTEDRNADKALLAYLVMNARTDAEELRAWLRERLPAYMLPQGFIFLDELPLTPNGKTDRKALPDWSESPREKTFAPRTETERSVAEIWREVLKLDAVSVDDNFFLLGGHSLLATRMMSQVESRFRIRVSLRDFYANPTIASLAELIEKGDGRSNLLVIKPRSQTQNAPLSHAQSRLWFLHQYERDNTAYNMPGAVRLLGDLNINVLEQSLTEVGRRHEILRTVFVMTGDEPAQMVLPPRRLRIPVTDLGDVPESEREIEALRLATVEAQQPFDLSAGPLIRFSLLRLNPREHLLLMTVHHIVFDGWSIGVLIGELSALYEAYLNGQETPLPELPVQYADYAVWQREWLQGEVLDEQLAYWQRQLAGAPEALHLPTDKPRTAVQTFNGETLPIELSPALVRDLKRLADDQDATLFMVLLAAFQVLLARYSGQTDVLIGATVANRNRAEVERLIGFFVNMLVMRGDVSDDPIFIDYLKQVRKVSVEAYAHQDLPFELLIESIDLPRSAGRAPLFQVAFAMQNVPTTDFELPGLQLELVNVDSGRAPFDLTLSLSETEDQRIAGSINYNSDLFLSATIERMQGHYRTLLEGLVAEPNRRVSELPLLTETEQRELLAGWNHSESAPVESSIQELFETQARQRPQAIALVAGEQEITYEELNERANQLAHYLRRLGVGPEVTVGLCVQRSAELIVGVLGILKAGGAYVPLDVQYPAERLQYMLNDAQIKVLLTDEAAAPAFTGYTGEVVSLERKGKLVAAESRENPEAQTSGKNLAYIMYTSGSTGQPKGVSVEHRGVVRLVKNTNYARFSAEEVFLQLAPSSFDASTFEIWGALLNGARLVLMPSETPSLENLGEVIREQQVSTLWLTSGLFNLMVDEQLEDLKSLKQLLAGGDVLSVVHVNKFLAENSDCCLINGYGPTENTTFTCCYSINEGPVTGSVPIGYPISNTEVYVLDEHQRPVPAGVAGELYIGGQGLARGYVNEFAMTAERFVPHPYSDKPGARLYRTGDLVRYLPGGLIEFLGRRDKQVKVRGFRVELSEIENVLSQHQSVRQAIVIVAQRAGVEDKQLLAFLTLENESEITAGDLRSYLQQRLPEYMAPQGFTFVDEIPLTPNGKVDRNALLARMNRDVSCDQDITESWTNTETVLASMWQELLGLSGIGVADNFFEVGGHSLLATRLVSQVRKRFGVEVGLRSFFENATIRALAQQIDSAQTQTASSNARSIKRASREQYRVRVSTQDAILLPEALRKETVHS